MFLKAYSAKHPLDFIRVAWSPGILTDLDVHQTLITTGLDFTESMWHMVTVAWSQAVAKWDKYLLTCEPDLPGFGLKVYRLLAS